MYIKRRDDNIAANAVVGVFLRVLEYFNGLLFLTTNRIDDIDEAIISRCIAMVRYRITSYNVCYTKLLRHPKPHQFDHHGPAPPPA